MKAPPIFIPRWRLDTRTSRSSGPGGQGVIRLDKSSKGYMGGAVGAHRTTKNFDALAADLEATFRAAGVLVQAQQL